MESLGIGSRRQGNQSALDKKKRKKRKKKTREGKRSSASSASASGSPDSTGQCHPKTQGSRSCPSILGSNNNNNSLELSKDSTDSSNAETRINECLRWPAHSLYIENSFRTDLVGKFPMPGATEEEENERIAIYKMNRRKRYLAAQQALIDKYPDGGLYVSSSGSSSGHDALEDGIRIRSSRSAVGSGDSKIIFHSGSVNGSPDFTGREIEENIPAKFLSNANLAQTLSKASDLNTIAFDSRKKACSGI